MLPVFCYREDDVETAARETASCRLWDAVDFGQSFARHTEASCWRCLNGAQQGALRHPGMSRRLIAVAALLRQALARFNPDPDVRPRVLVLIHFLPECRRRQGRKAELEVFLGMDDPSLFVARGSFVGIAPVHL